jgi:phenylpyruvate tautomerase PptA (4-oxalocrotonate tautomerase family)
MPYYEVIVAEGVLTKERRDTVADEITKIHCEETGAPRSFVHAHFKEYAKNNTYTGGNPTTSRPSSSATSERVALWPNDSDY